MFSFGLLIWWIASLVYSESEEFTFLDGAVIAGEIMMVASAVHFAWRHLL